MRGGSTEAGAWSRIYKKGVSPIADSNIYGTLGATKLAKTAFAHLMAIATVTGASGQSKSFE